MQMEMLMRVKEVLSLVDLNCHQRISKDKTGLEEKTNTPRVRQCRDFCASFGRFVRAAGGECAVSSLKQPIVDAANRRRLSFYTAKDSSSDT